MLSRSKVTVIEKKGRECPTASSCCCWSNPSSGFCSRRSSWGRAALRPAWNLSKEETNKETELLLTDGRFEKRWQGLGNSENSGRRCGESPRLLVVSVDLGFGESLVILYISSLDSLVRKRLCSPLMLSVLCHIDRNHYPLALCAVVAHELGSPSMLPSSIPAARTSSGNGVNRTAAVQSAKAPAQQK